MKTNKKSLKEYGIELRSEDTKLFDEIQEETKLEQLLYKEVSELRKNEKLTQQEVADTLGVSQAVIGRFESGKTKNPSIGFLNKVANALGYTMNITFEKK